MIFIIMIIIIIIALFRHSRLQNCTHDWDTYEMSQIMKPQ